jgi:glutaredoxin 2
MHNLLWTIIFVMGMLKLSAPNGELMEKTKIAKVTMSPKAEGLLNEMVTKTNDGFTGGKVTKHDLLSWVVTHFAENYFERNRERIQADHFDRLAHLDNLVKRIKKARHDRVEDQEAETQLKQLMDNTPKPKERAKQTKSDHETA